MGFFEILLIAIVTLLVVGPERMPEAVRTIALTIGRLKRSFDAARSELEKHIGADEIRRQLHNERVMENLDRMDAQLTDIERSIHNDDPMHSPQAIDPLINYQDKEDDQDNLYDYDPGHHQNLNKPAEQPEDKPMAMDKEAESNHPNSNTSEDRSASAQNANIRSDDSSNNSTPSS